MTTGAARLTALGLAVAASNAAAQGTATYSFAFGSPTGPSQWFANPGQTSTVYVLVAISPDIGAPVGTPPQPIWGLSHGTFSINIVGPGTWANIGLHQPYNAPGASAGAVIGNDVTGVSWDLGPLLAWPHPLPANPAVVWSGTFTAGASNTNCLFIALGPVSLLYGDPAGAPLAVKFEPIGTPGFVGHPAPGSVLVLAIASLVRAPRRRSA